MTASDISFIQPLSKRWANGDIMGYEYRICKSINTELMTSDPTQTSADSVNLFVNCSMERLYDDKMVTSKIFHVEEDLSYWITVEANTSAGFNESLVPEKVIIPNKNSGSLAVAITW